MARLNLRFKASFWNVWSVILLLEGLAMCIHAWVTYTNIRASLQERSVTSQGRIISCKMERVVDLVTSDGDPVSTMKCLPTVRFQTASNQEIDVVSSYPWEGFHSGDSVSVQYRPDRPQDAIIVSDGLWSDVQRDDALALFSIILSGISLIIRWISSLRRKRLRGKFLILH